jgi:hypothetical protein
MSTPKVSTPGHPDDVFGANKPEDRSAAALPPPLLNRPEAVLSSGPRASLLTEEVAALAASLGLRTSKGTAAYEPDAFIAAVRKVHEQLASVQEQLAEQHRQQSERERDLQAREQAIEFREKRMNAFDQLVEVRRGFLGRLFSN